MIRAQPGSRPAGPQCPTYVFRKDCKSHPKTSAQLSEYIQIYSEMFREVNWVKVRQKILFGSYLFRLQWGQPCVQDALMALWMVIGTAVLRGIAKNLRRQRAENAAKQAPPEQPAADAATPGECAHKRTDAGPPGRRSRKRRPPAIPLITAVPIKKLNIAPSPPGGGAILARCKGGDVDG